MSEQWKTISGHSGNYSVSNMGRVKRVKPALGARVGHVLVPRINSLGYQIVGLYDKGKGKTHTIHSLVVDAFMPGQRTKGMQVNHKDGNKKNNRLDNLEVVTRQQNVRHAVENGLSAPGRSGESNRILNEDKVRKIKESYREGRAQRLLAEDYGVSRHTINAIVCGRTWKHVA